MANKNQIFLKKYNELDVLCREKYNMFRTKDGERNNMSAIREYAYSLPEMYKEKLLNLIKLRNIIAHTDAAQASDQSIRDLDSFIIMVKKNANPKNHDAFDAASYISHNVKKMHAAINEADIDDEDLPFEAKKKIKNDLYGYITKLNNANKLETAKRIVRDFYTYLDNIDDHPLVIAQALEEAKSDAIETLTESYNDVMDERKNPFVRMKAKEIFNRYKNMILKARNESEVENLAERGDDALSELY